MKTKRKKIETVDPKVVHLPGALIKVIESFSTNGRHVPLDAVGKIQSVDPKTSRLVVTLKYQSAPHFSITDHRHVLTWKCFQRNIEVIR